MARNDQIYKNKRITVLLLGSDQRGGTDRRDVQDDLSTDTIMILSINPAQRTALMLSLPRDIYCQISPEHGLGRINSAYRLGEETGYPGGGGTLAIAAVQSLIHVHIDYYVLINFKVFYTVMDAIGPITVCPRQEIYDDHFPDQNYGIMEVYFPAGCQELDSRRLLQYARVRHTAGYDFGRAQRQQEIIRSVRHKVLTTKVFFRLILGARKLWRRMKSQIVTNMPLLKMLYVSAYIFQIPRENIYAGLPTVQHGHLRNVVTTNKEQVLLPIHAKLRDLVQLLFEASPETTETKTAPDSQPQSLVLRLQQRSLRGAIQLALWLLQRWFILQRRR